MNHAQKYLAQANRHIAELTVQIAHQRATLGTRLTRASAQRWRSRCLIRSNEVFAYSRSTGYFCSVVNPPNKRESSKRPDPPKACFCRRAGTCHDGTVCECAS
jgi:hypothetical protein